MLRTLNLPVAALHLNVSSALSEAKTDWRSHVAAIAMSTAGLLQLTEFEFRSPLLVALWGSIIAGIIVAASMDIQVRPLRSFRICLWIVVVCGWIAIPVSALTGGNLPQTISLAIFLLPMLLYFRYGQYQQLDRVMYWMIPGLFLHSGWALYEALVIGQHRVQGLSTNQNAGAGILAFAIIYFASHPKLKWITLPMIAALPFFGSRWVTVVTVGMVVLIFASRYVPWRYLIFGLILAVVFAFTFGNQLIIDSYRIEGRDARDHRSDAISRMLPQDGDGTIWRDLLIPSGFLNTGIHSLPIRLATEFGIYSGVAFIVLGGMGLCRKPRYTSAWWMLFMSLALSVMYYHTWVGPIAMFWWVPLGVRHSEIAEAKEKARFRGKIESDPLKHEATLVTSQPKPRENTILGEIVQVREQE